MLRQQFDCADDLSRREVLHRRKVILETFDSVKATVTWGAAWVALPWENDVKRHVRLKEKYEPEIGT